MTNEKDELMEAALRIECALLSNIGEYAGKESIRIEAEAAMRADRLIKAVNEIYKANVINDRSYGHL